MRRVLLMAVVVLVAGASFFITTGFSSAKRPVYLVRAIFDNASAAVSGEDVRVAGANVGSIQSLGVTDANRAAVTLAINNAAFTPFHANATCTIRPQSLIGEEYVDCMPGTSSAPALAKITQGTGKGSHLLPVTQTSSPIDSDIVQDISTEPVRQSLAVILDELGTGLAARGSDLNAVIRRANPALGNTDRVLRILASQDHVLARLATDSDTVLAPLARERRQLAGFVTQANTTSVASAQRAAAESQTFKLFPSFLRQLRPLMADLGSLADQGTPLMKSLGQSAAAQGQEFANLTPFAVQARKALIELGTASRQSQPALVASLPLAKRLRNLGTSELPSATLLDRLLTSLDNTGGIEQLMNLLYQGAVAGNGFNSMGHYLRAEPLITTCTVYSTSPIPGCSAKFGSSGGAAAASVAHTTHEAATSAKPTAGAKPTPPASAGSARRDGIVAQAVRETRSATKPTSDVTGLLSFLTGSQG